MKQTIDAIPLGNLAVAFLPVFVVITIIWYWKLGLKHSIHGVARMLIQLLLVGYVLTYIFEADNYWTVLGVLSVMLTVSSWISLRTTSIPAKKLFFKSFIAILCGGGAVLFLVTQGALNLDPWYLPSYMVPLAGMIFANSMNSISLAGERLEAELSRGLSFEGARNKALNAALIPITNSLFAVGVVSIPGMMTGQILSGVSPFIAARYQIMVMCMVFGSTGLSVAFFLYLARKEFVSSSVVKNEI